MTLGLWLREMLEDSMMEIAAESALSVAARARDLAPRRSGALAASIEAEGNSVKVSAPYAVAVEFSRPFLRPALLEEREAVKARIAAFLARERS